MPAQPEEIEAAEREGVVIRDAVTVTSVIGVLVAVLIIALNVFLLYTTFWGG